MTVVSDTNASPKARLSTFNNNNGSRRTRNTGDCMQEQFQLAALTITNRWPRTSSSAGREKGLSSYGQPLEPMAILFRTDFALHATYCKLVVGGPLEDSRDQHVILWNIAIRGKTKRVCSVLCCLKGCFLGLSRFFPLAFQ